MRFHLKINSKVRSKTNLANLRAYMYAYTPYNYVTRWIETAVGLAYYGHNLASLKVCQGEAILQ